MNFWHSLADGHQTLLGGFLGKYAQKNLTVPWYPVPFKQTYIVVFPVLGLELEHCTTKFRTEKLSMCNVCITNLSLSNSATFCRF
jgi:hypothetical protein